MRDICSSPYNIFLQYYKLKYLLLLLISYVKCVLKIQLYLLSGDVYL